MRNVENNPDSHAWGSVKAVSGKIIEDIATELAPIEPELRQYLEIQKKNKAIQKNGGSETEYLPVPQAVLDAHPRLEDVAQAYQFWDQRLQQIDNFWEQQGSAPKQELTIAERTERALGEDSLNPADHLYMHANYAEGVMHHLVEKYGDEIARQHNLEAPTRDQLQQIVKDTHRLDYQVNEPHIPTRPGLVPDDQPGARPHKARENLFQNKDWNWSQAYGTDYGAMAEGQESKSGLFEESGASHFQGSHLYRPLVTNKYNRAAIRSGVPLVSGFSDTTQKNMKAALYLGQLEGDDLGIYKTLVIANMADKNGHAMDETARAVDTYGMSTYKGDLLSTIHSTYFEGETGRDLDKVITHYRSDPNARARLFPNGPKTKLQAIANPPFRPDEP